MYLYATFIFMSILSLISGGGAWLNSNNLKFKFNQFPDLNRIFVICWIYLDTTPWRFDLFNLFFSIYLAFIVALIYRRDGNEKTNKNRLQEIQLDILIKHLNQKKMHISLN